MADIGSSLKNIWLKGMEAIGNTASNIASNTKSKVDEMNLVNRRAEILKDFGNQAYALFLKGEHFPEELDAQLRELVKLDEDLNDLRAERLAGVKASEEAAETATEDAGVAFSQAEDSPENDTEELRETAETIDEAADVVDRQVTDAYNQAGEEAAEAILQPASAGSEDCSGEINDVQDAGSSPVPVIQVIQQEEETKPASSLSSAINDLFESSTVKDAAGKVNSALDSLEEGLKKFGEEMDHRIDEISDSMMK